jgi:outer membrane phospholipase A
LCFFTLGADIKKESNDSSKDETKFLNKTSDVEKQLVIDSKENEQAMFDRAVALSLESFKEEMKTREEVRRKKNLIKHLTTSILSRQPPLSLTHQQRQWTQKMNFCAQSVPS